MKIRNTIAALLLLIIGLAATGCGVYYYDRGYYPGHPRYYHQQHNHGYYNHGYDHDRDRDSWR